MDLPSIVEKMVKLVRMIKNAIEKVDHNKMLCSDIRDRVETIGGILSAVNNTKIMSPCMDMPLRLLRKALQEALKLIKDCQEKSRVAHFLTADEMSKKLQDADQKITSTMLSAQFAMIISYLQSAPSVVILTLSPDTATEGDRKKENRKGERKEARDDGEKRRENEDVEEKRDTERKKVTGKGKKHKETQNDGEKRREKEDVEEKRDAERKKENWKGKKNKETQEDAENRREKKDVEEKRDAERKKEIRKGKKNKETQEDEEKRRKNKDVEEKRDAERKSENGKGKKNKETQEDGEKRREKKDVEEKGDGERKKENWKGKKNKETQEDGEKRREKKDVEEKDGERKKENGKGKKNKETQEDGEKRREKKDVEEKSDAERKKQIGKEKKNKETQDNVEEKREGPGLVRPKDSSVVDHYDSSRKEEKEAYYSCSSSCSVSKLKAVKKDLTEKNISEQDGDYIMHMVKLSDGTRVVAHRIGRFGEQTTEYELHIRVGMAKLEHTNILEVLGYFYHGGFLYMVEESFGILSSGIYGNPSKRKELSWQQCSSIILDIADGVVYLHQRDLKHMSPWKICIGPECVAKISYFFISSCLKMKRGFAPPEYESHGRFSFKTDVYSYGVLLLELITGQKSNRKRGGSYNSLTALVWQRTLDKEMRECIQPRLINASDGPQIIEDIERCILIALLCVEEDPALRPTMHDVVGWLRNKNQVLPMIHRPAYITKDTATDRDVDTPPTTMSTPTDPEGSEAPRLRRGERARKSVQGDSTV